MSTEKAVLAAEHLVGNLWFNLQALPLVAGRLEPDAMRLIAGTQAAMAYSEMCRLLASDRDRLSAGSLEAGLKLQSFDFEWLNRLQARVLPETVENLYAYTEEINNAADLRCMQQHCMAAVAESQGDSAKADVLTAQLMQKLAGVNRSATFLHPVATVTQSIRERLAKIRTGEVSWGASTGFIDLDRLMRLVDGELIMVAGRPSQGKTAQGMHMAVARAAALAKSGERGQVLIFSIEMGKDDLFLRSACALAGVNSELITTNQANAQDFTAVDNALAFLDTLPISVDDTSSVLTEQVYFRTVMANAQNPVRLVMADHTELVGSSTTAKMENETLRISNILRSFKGIARTVNAPFIDLHQLGREVEQRPDKQPALPDLKYAGEAHADKILFIHRPEYYLKRNVACQCDDRDREGVALITLAKNRNGPVGRVRLSFVEKYARFGNLAQ